MILGFLPARNLFLAHDFLGFAVSVRAGAEVV